MNNTIETFVLGKISFGNADYNELMGSAMIIVGIFLIFYIVLFEKQEKKVETKIVEPTESTTVETEVEDVEIIEQINKQPQTPQPTIVSTDVTNTEAEESPIKYGFRLRIEPP